jgi:hypothetical protein
MSTINRSEFRGAFQDGIDLEDRDLKAALVGSGVSKAELKQADVDGDGLLRGRKELDLAFKVVDGVDYDGRASTFDDGGAGGRIYRGMLAAKAPPAYHGVEIVQAARDRVASDGEGYGFHRTPTSPLDGLSGNAEPGTTHPAWLVNRNKCNQFAGDVLTQAGLRAPTVTMADGSLHYARAEAWPTYGDLFNRVTSPAEIKVGDLVVRDDTRSRGDSTAHIEVVTGTNPMRTTGAHQGGAYERRENWLAGATYNPASGSWIRGSDEIHVLRPKQTIGQ